MLKPRAQQLFFSQKGESQTKPNKPTQQKTVPAATETETKNCESQTKNYATPTKPNKKKKRANSTRYFPCRHRHTASTKMTDKSPRENSESRTPKKSCAKIKPKGSGELETFSLSGRVPNYKRTNPIQRKQRALCRSKNKKSASHPNGKLIAQARN
jgi:hypothetical protein